MPTDGSRDYNLPDEVTEILRDFRQTAPVRPNPDERDASAKDRFTENDEKRVACIHRLGRWSEKNPQDRAPVQRILFRLLEQDLTGRPPNPADSLETPYGTEEGKRDYGVNGLMRSYIPIFIGVLHWWNPRDNGLWNDAREGLLGRLIGEDLGEHGVSGHEYSATVRQWLIRILRRVFATDDGFARKLAKRLDEEIDYEDNVLTQIVMASEVSRLEPPQEAAASLLMKKLSDPTRSGSTVAAEGLERLGSGLERSEEAIEELCSWLEELQEQSDDRWDQNRSAAKALADWEFFVDESVERRAVIKAIAAVGPSDEASLNERMIGVLFNEVERSGSGRDGYPDVGVAAVLALGQLGCSLVKTSENGDGGQADEAKRLRDGLTSTAVGGGDATVCDAAARALTELMENEKTAAECLVEYALRSREECDDERLADAARLVDAESAIDRLARVSGAGRSWARDMIAKIGGAHAIETLGPPEWAHRWKYVIDWVAVLLVVPALVGTWIAMSDATRPFIQGSLDSWWPQNGIIWGAFLGLAVGVIGFFLVVSPDWAEKLKYVRWGADELKKFQDSKFFRWGGGVLVAIALVGTLIAAADVPPWPDWWWWPENPVVWSWCFVLSAFLASVVIAFPFREIRAGRYLVSSILAFVFSLGMVAAIASGIWVAREEEGPVLLDGPVHVFRGSFVENGAPQLIASLTAPPCDPPSPPPCQSIGNLAEAGVFGAPVWVVLLAVLGSGLLTVAVIVTEVRRQPDFSDLRGLRQRVGALLEHQFYILFAPFGALFVFAGLRTAHMLEEPLTVALAAFGAGLAWNVVMARAVRLAGRTVYPQADEEGGERSDDVGVREVA